MRIAGNARRPVLRLVVDAIVGESIASGAARSGRVHVDSRDDPPELRDRRNPQLHEDLLTAVLDRANRDAQARRYGFIRQAA